MYWIHRYHYYTATTAAATILLFSIFKKSSKATNLWLSPAVFVENKLFSSQIQIASFRINSQRKNSNIELLLYEKVAKTFKKKQILWPFWPKNAIFWDQWRPYLLGSVRQSKEYSTNSIFSTYTCNGYLFYLFGSYSWSKSVRALIAPPHGLYG